MSFISLNMGEKIAQGACVITCKNVMAGHISFEIDLAYPQLRGIE